MMKTYLDKLGIKIENNFIHFKNRHLPLTSFTRENIFEKIIQPLGIRKTRGTSYYDGKQFINKEKLEKELLKYRKRYSVEVSFKFSYTDPKGVRRNIKNYNTTSYITTNPSNIQRNRLIEAAEQYVEDMTTSLTDIEITIIKTPRVIEIQEASNLNNHPVFRSMLAYPNMKLKPGENTGLCGFDYLMRNYPKKCESIEALEKFFFKPRTSGLTPVDFLKFSEFHNISIYLCDLLGNKILQRTSDKQDRHKTKENHPIYGVIANNHIYEIDTSLKNKLTSIILGQTSTFSGDLVEDRKYETKEDPREISFTDNMPEKIEDNTIYYIKEKNLTEYYLDLIKKGSVYASKWKGEHVIEIYMNNSKLSVSPMMDDVKTLCQDLDLKFTNQSVPSIARQQWSSFDGEWKSSVLNTETRRLYQNNESPLWVSAFREGLDNQFPENYKIGAIDQAKQYTYICQQGNFYTHDIFDLPIEYDGHEITHGMYYVECDYQIPFKGNGFYDYQVVRAGLEYNLISHDQIQYYIKGHHQEQNDEKMRNFVDHIYDKTKQAKFIMNTIIGSFGITKSRQQTRTVITTSPYEAFYYHHKLGQDSTITELDVNLFKIQGYKKVIHTASDVPIRLQIVNRANLETFKLLKYVEKSNAIPIGIKTDCIIYAYNPKKGKVKTVKTPKIGDYRLEKLKELPEFKENEVKQKEFYLKEYDWEDIHVADDNFNFNKILMYDRVYIKGFAGSGKSYLINQLREYLGNKFLYTSFTHTAANNINGQTLNAALGINYMTNKTTDKTLRALIDKYDGIIIDEVNQCGKVIFEILSQLPKSFKIYAFGDFRQELPVAEDLHVESDMFKLLMHGNMIELTKQWRSDSKYAEACKEYHDEMQKLVDGKSHVEYEKFKHENDYICRDILHPYIQDWNDDNSIPNDINIVKTNAMRLYINEQKMKKTEIYIEHAEANTEGQPIYLYEGLPLVANETNKKLKITNNELYVVKEYDEHRITLKYRLLNDNPAYVAKRQDELEITYDELARYFVPGYAFTTYKAEGQTISYPHTIWEFNRMHHKTRYTALTRSTDSNLISIRNVKTPLAFYDPDGRGTKKALIYRITDGVKEYYGSTTRTLQERFDEHKKCEQNSKLYRYMRGVGLDNFRIELVKEFNYINKAQVFKRENYYIEKYDAIKMGLNQRMAA